MLARRLTTILLDLTLAEAIETTRMHNVTGFTSNRAPFITTCLFLAPHHTLSDVGLIGGGQAPMPGDVSRAHYGMLFLDELPEFRRHVLEVLRQPLEPPSQRCPVARWREGVTRRCGGRFCNVWKSPMNTQRPNPGEATTERRRPVTSVLG